MAAGSRAALSFVERALKLNSVVVFSRSTCPFCSLAKNVLQEAGVKDMKVYELDGSEHVENGPEIQAALASITGRKTVPNVFLNGESIGGGTETKNLYESGQLLEMLKKINQ